VRCAAVVQHIAGAAKEQPSSAAVDDASSCQLARAPIGTDRSLAWAYSVSIRIERGGRPAALDQVGTVWVVATRGPAAVEPSLLDQVPKRARGQDRPQLRGRSGRQPRVSQRADSLTARDAGDRARGLSGPRRGRRHARLPPGRADSGRVDSGRADSGRADSGRADSGRADSLVLARPCDSPRHLRAAFLRLHMACCGAVAGSAYVDLVQLRRRYRHPCFHRPRGTARTYGGACSSESSRRTGATRTDLEREEAAASHGGLRHGGCVRARRDP
jgi:hypothetical protein